MMENPSLKYPEPISPEIRKLYPNLTDEELRVAQANLRRYVEVVKRIVERLEQ